MLFGVGDGVFVLKFAFLFAIDFGCPRFGILKAHLAFGSDMANGAFLDQCYEVAGRRIDPVTGNLHYQGKKVHLRRKELEVLAVLAAHRGQCVRRVQFVDQLWQGNPLVGEQGLTDTIAALRRSLQDRDSESPLIRTIPRQGYQLNASVLLAPKANHPAFADGAEVHGRPGWTLQARISQTELSETWLAVEAGSNRQRIFKFCRSEQQLQELRREVSLMRYLRESLAGRNDVVAILDWRLHEPPYFLEYEPHGHGDLLKWSEAQGGLAQVPIDKRLALFSDLVAALAAVHSVSIVHRNLSASAIGIEQREGQWHARIGGFGFGLLTEPERLKTWQLSSAGLSVDAQGAPPDLYRPLGANPEAALTSADDIYALGVLGVQLATGQWSLPVLAESVASVQPDALRVLLQRCLHPQAIQRPDAATLRLELNLVLAPPEFSPAVATDSIPSTANAAKPPPTSAARDLMEEGPTPSQERMPKPVLDAFADKSIGPYRILDILGHGGMGTVYLAEQHLPVRRKVALKLIKAGVDSEQVLARFEAERQALALMSHPNIAAILESGSTPAGLPYFAMEYVPGVDICTHCDRQKLDVRRRVELFLQVCDGVLHAHQKGIVHRDLKPGNIMIRQQAEQPALVKVIDFGVAKSLQGHLVGAGPHTRFGQFVGTPAYCSPEQVASPGNQVDTRSDIYSLGVVLYELLIGVTPRDEADLGECTPHDLAKLLRDSPAPTLISRFSNLSNDQKQRVATLHAMTLEGMHNVLKNDLDCVVSKCIAADPENRYATVQDLKKDLCSWLEHRPVEARTLSKFSYLPRHFNRSATAVLAVALFAIFVIASAAIFLQIQAYKEITKANAATREAEQALAFHIKQINSLKPYATGESIKENALRELEQNLSTKGIDQQSQAKIINEVEQGLAKVNSADLAISVFKESYFTPSLKILDSEKSLDSLSKADIYQSLAKSMRRMSLHEQALQAIKKSVELRTRLSGQHNVRTLEAKIDQALILSDMADVGAKEIVNDLLPFLKGGSNSAPKNTPRALLILTFSSIREGDLVEAEKHQRAAVDAALRIHGDNSLETMWQYVMLSDVLLRKGNVLEAENLAKKAHDGYLNAQDPPIFEKLLASKQLANCLIKKGDFKTALQLTSSSVSIAEANYGRTSRLVIMALRERAYILEQAEDYNAALSHYQESETRAAEIYDQSIERLSTLSKIGDILATLGRFEESESILRATRRKVQAKLGPNAEITIAVSQKLARMLFLQGNFQEAEKLQRHLLQASGASPPETQLSLRVQLANTLLALNNKREALQLLANDISASNLDPRTESHEFLLTVAEIFAGSDAPEKAESLLSALIDQNAGANRVSARLRAQASIMLSQLRKTAFHKTNR